MEPAAFLFDLDGTLVDTEAVWARAMVDFVVDRGGRTTVSQSLELVVGHNWLDIHRMLHERFPMLGETTAIQDSIELHRYYDRHATEPQALRIESSIAFFRRASEIASCAIVSGSPHDDVVNAVAFCGLADRVRLILGAGDYERGKPDPSGYLKAADLLGVLPKDCVVIEDSAVGVAAGVAAGMKVIALDRGQTVPQHFEGETWRVKDLSEIDVEKEFGA